jgi:hypothetical protein
MSSLKNAKQVVHKQGRRIIQTVHDSDTEDEDEDEDEELAQPLPNF